MRAPNKTGFFIAAASIPIWLAWLQYVSIFYWAYRALLVSQYVGLTLTCTQSELIPSATPGAAPVCPFTSGEQFLAAQGIDPAQIGFYWVMLLTLWLSFWLIALVCLFLTTREHSIRPHPMPGIDKEPRAWMAALRDSNSMEKQVKDEVCELPHTGARFRAATRKRQVSEANEAMAIAQTLAKHSHSREGG
jgi:hypothetical protein